MKLSELFANAKLPAMLCVASESGSDHEGVFTFSKISDRTSGKAVTILSNLEKPRSPLTGDELDVSATNVETASTAISVKDTLAAFKCIASCLNCDHDTLTIPELAEELDAKMIHCMNCGEEVKAFYDGDLFSDESADDLEEDDSDDVVDAIDEEDEESEDETEEDSDPTSDGEGDELESDDPVGEVSDDNADDEDVDDVNIEQDQEETDEEEDEDVSTVKASGDAPTTEQPTNAVETVEAPAATTETPAAETQASETDANSNAEVKTEETPAATTEASEAPTTEEAPAPAPVDAPAEIADEAPAMTSEVVVASAADYNETLQFARLSDTSRYEVFLGTTHIGSLLKDESSTGVQGAFAKQDLLRNAFGSAFWKNSDAIANGEFAALKDFGFKPSTISVDLNKVVANLVDEKVADLEQKHEEKINETVNAVVATMNVAAAGLNKGMLPGTNFHKELAKTLNGFGIKNASEVAARFVKEHTPAFFNSVVTAAANLRKESPDYVRGLASSIESASFKTVLDNENDTLVTSALLPTPVRTEQPTRHAEVETASAPNSANIGSVWTRFSRR